MRTSPKVEFVVTPQALSNQQQKDLKRREPQRHKEEFFFSFAVKEKAFPLCLRDSVAKAFMTEGDKPSS